MLVKLDHFPNFRGENKNMKPAPSYSWPADSGMAGPTFCAKELIHISSAKELHTSIQQCTAETQCGLKDYNARKGPTFTGGMLHEQKLKVVLRHQALQYGDQL